MKKASIIAVLLMLITGLMAQKGNKPGRNTNSDIYCVMEKDSQSLITLNDKPVTIDVPLADGSILSPNGVLLKKDGTKVTLKRGDCVDQNGKTLAKPMPMKKSEYQGQINN
ncbi:MAG: DUF6799 domain-containing protein [Chitinophagales bacterium]